MAYEVTATRKRPQVFQELVGQEFVVATLTNSIKQGRLAHAYLFAGPRGVGKTSAARILAKALNCEHGPTPTPCGQCTMCREIGQGNALDVMEIDGASNTSVNDVRQIKDEVLFAPQGGRYKIYIIDEVHMLSNSAFNALLKTIEEPPPYIVFIFATTEIHKVPPTIRSRCQQFNFRLIPTGEIVRMLGAAAGEAGVDAEEEALLWIAKESTGSLRDAYTLLDQALSLSPGRLTLAQIRERLGIMDFESMNALAESAARGKAAEVLEKTREILQRGISVERFVVDMAEYFRNQLLVSQGIERRDLLGFSASEFSPAVREAFSPAQLERAVESFLQLYRDLKYTLNPIFELELVMSRLADLARVIGPAELLARLEQLRAGIGAGAAVQRRPTADRPSPAARPETAARAPTDPSAASSDAAAQREEIDLQRLAQEVAQGCKKEKPVLASALGKALRWEVSREQRGVGVRIIFPAGESFSREMVQGEVEFIAGVARAILGSAVTVKTVQETASDSGPTSGQVTDSRIELVKRVFRGQIVEGG